MSNYVIRGWFGTDVEKAKQHVEVGQWWVNAASLPVLNDENLDIFINNGRGFSNWGEASYALYERWAFIDLETQKVWVYYNDEYDADIQTPYLVGTEPDANHKLTWDEDGERWYSNGISKGFICVHGENPNNVVVKAHTGCWFDYGETIKHGACRHPWSGLISVNMADEGGESSGVYADDQKYLNLTSSEQCKFTIEAYQSPEAFDACDGTLNILNGLGFYEQPRKKFDFGFFTKLSNDLGQDTIKIGTSVIPLGQYHIFYNCTATPSDRQYNSMTDTPEAMTLSWDVTTEPMRFQVTTRLTNSGILEPVEISTSHIVIDTRKLANATNPTIGVKLNRWLQYLYDDRCDNETYAFQQMPYYMGQQFYLYATPKPPTPQPNPNPNPATNP